MAVERVTRPVEGGVQPKQSLDNYQQQPIPIDNLNKN